MLACTYLVSLVLSALHCHRGLLASVSIVSYLLAVSNARFMLSKAWVLESSKVTSSGASSSLDCGVSVNSFVGFPLSAVFEDDGATPRCFFPMLVTLTSSFRAATTAQRKKETGEESLTSGGRGEKHDTKTNATATTTTTITTDNDDNNDLPHLWNSEYKFIFG